LYHWHKKTHLPHDAFFMSTTALFVDFLIIGVQAGVWIVLVFLSIFGNNTINPAELKGWETIVPQLGIDLPQYLR